MANEKRLIDANQLIEHKYTRTPTEFEKGWNAAIDAVIEHAPTIDAVEVVHGRWIHDQIETCHPLADTLPVWVDVMQCSVCKEYIEGSHPKNYCPNCGAKMGGDGNA